MRAEAHALTIESIEEGVEFVAETRSRMRDRTIARFCLPAGRKDDIDSRLDLMDNPGPDVEVVSYEGGEPATDLLSESSKALNSLWRCR